MCYFFPQKVGRLISEGLFSGKQKEWLSFKLDAKEKGEEGEGEEKDSKHLSVK